MSVIELKPHKLSFLTSTMGYEDENGDYHVGDSSWSDGIECGVVPAGKANELKFEDGSVMVYAYTVTLPIDCKDFEVDERVRLTFFNGEAREFRVKGFHRYQLQCKMWL